MHMSPLIVTCEYASCQFVLSTEEEEIENSERYIWRRKKAKDFLLAI